MPDSSLDLSDTEQEFISEILHEYAAIYRAIDFEDRHETDVVPRLINHLFIDVLGHSEADYEQENDWNDIIVRDDDGNAVIVVEAKRRSKDVENAIGQGFEYASERGYVEYFVATNIDEMLIYETCAPDHPDAESREGYTARRIAEINFEGFVNAETGRALVSSVGIDEYQDLLELNKLRREEVADTAKFDRFDLPESQIQNVADQRGFETLLAALEKSINEYFMVYSLKKFDEYERRYEQLTQEYEQLRGELEMMDDGDGSNDNDGVAALQRELSEIEQERGPYRRFHEDYEVWKRLSNRVGDDEAENKRIFCRESVYAQINKILFIRIAEDKGLLNQMVSDGGVVEFFDFWENYAKYTGPDRDYTDLFAVACDEMGDIYEHLYTGSIFDWELRDGSELNEAFRRTFWHLNHYDFSDVDRDVLGHLYEQYLPKEERQTLGEFYTPTTVVNFILDRLGYTPDQPIENQDILDPATGSGTFLVQAANRLVERLDRKGVEPKRALEIVQERLHGLDINPFAVNIAQINLVFQIIDLYREVKEEHPNYTIDTFNIYQTDSLKRGVDSKITGFHSDTVVRKYQRDKEQAEAIKSGEYDIVVGNPPYVYYNDIPSGQRATYNDAFPKAAHRQYDVLILFIDSVRDWLKPGGEVGYITSNKFTTNQYGEKLRKNMPRHVFVEEFIDFADAGVFEDAVNYPCVFTMRRKTDDEELDTDEYQFPFVEVNEEMDSVPALLDHIETHIGDEYEDGYITAFPVSSASLDEQSWKFIPREDTTILDAINEGAEQNRSFADLCDRVELGIKAGELPAYLVTDEEITEYDLERDLLHPVLEGGDVRRWREPESQHEIIYAHPDLDIDNYPNTREYLEQYRDVLENRTQVDSWWELREPRPGAVTDESKLITPSIAYYNNFTLLSSDEAYPVNTIYYAVPDDADEHFLLGVANSIVMQFYMRMEGTPYRGDYLMYYGNDWGSLPIARDSAIEERIAETVEDIIEFIEGIEAADRILDDPARIYDQRDVETLPLSDHPAIESFELGDTEVGTPRVDGGTITFGDLSARIDFFDGRETCRELVMEMLSMKSFESARDVQDLRLPANDGKVDKVLAALDGVSDDLTAAAAEMQSLQDELDELVCDLYGFDDEVCDLLAERTETPANPLDTRVVKL
jgi:type I restriction-modification system DNA methylase subunit